MKWCNNPVCPLCHDPGRIFAADDTICPRCGEPLVTAPALGAAGYAAPPAGPRFPLLSAVLTVLVVLGAALALIGFMKAGSSGPPATTVPAPGDAATVTAVAVATREALVNTPVVLPTDAGAPPGTGMPPGAATPTSSLGISSITPAAGGSGVVGVRLCRQIAPAQTCNDTGGYTSHESFNLAVQAVFPPGGTHRVYVQWFGPNNTALSTSEVLTESRVGTYWVGFQLLQTVPWQVGTYHAVVYYDDAAARSVEIPVAP